MNKLDILYRDQWIIAIDKPAGMLVHPGADHDLSVPVAIKVLRDQIGAKVWLIHRLDRPTSGVLLFSLSAQLDPHLKMQFERREVQKRYCAVVAGTTPEKWIMQEPLQKKKSEPFRDAETRFILKHSCEFKGTKFSVLNITPLTGRYHQIRKHLAMSGFPIVGDYRYSDDQEMDQLVSLIDQTGLMLHAEQLEITHPVTSEDILISAPLPERFAPFRELPITEK